VLLQPAYPPFRSFRADPRNTIDLVFSKSNFSCYPHSTLHCDVFCFTYASHPPVHHEPKSTGPCIIQVPGQLAYLNHSLHTLYDTRTRYARAHVHYHSSHFYLNNSQNQPAIQHTLCSSEANSDLSFAVMSPAPSRPLPSAERGRYLNQSSHNQTRSCSPHTPLASETRQTPICAGTEFWMLASAEHGSYCVNSTDLQSHVHSNNLDYRARHVNLSGQIACTEHSESGHYPPVSLSLNATTILVG
jgi:hypothetical protein